jgi:hypothetical protein
VSSKLLADSYDESSKLLADSDTEHATNGEFSDGPPTPELRATASAKMTGGLLRRAHSLRSV